METTARAPDRLWVLTGPAGHLTFAWDPGNEAELAEARAAVERLRQQGYEFFLLDGSPAPAVVQAGNTPLSCQRVEAPAVVEPVPEGIALTTLTLSPRSQGALKQANLLTLEAIAAKTEDELLALDGVGAGTVARLKAALAAHGLALASTAAPAPAIPPAPARSPRQTIAVPRQEGG